MASKSQVLDYLTMTLRDLFLAQAGGQAYARLARAHGYVDGYMRAVEDAGLATKAELLATVQKAREGAQGPAIGRGRSDIAESA